MKNLRYLAAQEVAAPEFQTVSKPLRTRMLVRLQAFSSVFIGSGVLLRCGLGLHWAWFVLVLPGALGELVWIGLWFRSRKIHRI